MLGLERLRPSTKRIWSFLASIALFVGSFAVYASLIKPEYAAVNRLRGELGAKDEFLETQQQIVSKVEELLTQYRGAVNLQDKISFALPREEAIAPLLNQFFAIVADAGFVLETFSVGGLPARVGAASPGRASKIGSVQITARMSGTYAAFKVFLDLLERNVRIMDLVNAGISTPQIGAGSGSLAYTIAVAAYYQTE